MRFGELELNTIIGKNHKRAVLTVNNRATNLCWLAKLEEKESDPLKRLLNTSDNGKEFAGHREFAEALGIVVFFARPYYSWERGANENTNGLIRQYVPKGSSFENLTDEYTELIQKQVTHKKTRFFDAN